MKTLTDQLTNYARYHRDRRNIATHFVGIPMIVFGIEALLARPQLLVGGMAISPALIASVAATVYYVLLDLRFGVAMAAFLAASYGLGVTVAAQSLAMWGALSAVLFVGGWIIQFVGHGFEGKKPAFVDDIVGLLIGPLFIVAEAAFAIGLRTPVREAIEAEAGPTRARTVHG